MTQEAQALPAGISIAIGCQRSHKKSKVPVFRKARGNVVTAVMLSPQIGLEEKTNVTISSAMSSYLSSHVSQIGNDDNDSNDGIFPAFLGHDHSDYLLVSRDSEREEL